MVLSSFFQVVWAYFRIRRKEQLFIALAGFFLFVKEIIFFLSTRDVLIDFNLETVPFTFFHWVSLELIFNYLFVVCILLAHSLFQNKNNIDYPNIASSKKKLEKFFIYNFVMVVASVALVGFFKERGQDLTIFLVVLLIFHYVYLKEKLKWIFSNFYQFGIYLLNPLSRSLMGNYLSFSLFIFVLFAFFAVLFSPVLVNDLPTNAMLLYEQFETYLFGIKTMANVLIALYFLNVVRDAYGIQSEIDDVKTKQKKRYANFFAEVRNKIFKKENPKVIIDMLVDEVQSLTQAELVLVVLDGKEKKSFEKFSNVIRLNNNVISPSTLPYLEKIAESKKDFLINDLDSLDDEIKEYFSFLPQKKEHFGMHFEEEYLQPEEEKTDEGGLGSEIDQIKKSQEELTNGEEDTREEEDMDVLRLKEMEEEDQNVDKKSRENLSNDVNDLETTEQLSADDQKNEAKEKSVDDEFISNIGGEEIEKSQKIGEEISSVEDEHFVNDLLVKNYQFDEETSFHIFAINKKDNFYDSWTIADTYSKLEVLIEEFSFYKDYIVDYERIMDEKRSVAFQGDDLTRAIQSIGGFFDPNRTINQQGVKIIPIKVFPDRFSRSFLQIGEKENEILLMMFYVIGNPNFVILFYVLLQSAFRAIINGRKKTTAILNEFNREVAHFETRLLC